MSEQSDAGIPHQFSPGGGSDADIPQSCLLEITRNPVLIGVDHAHLPLPRTGIVSNPHRQTGDPAVYGGADLAALQINARLVKCRLGRLHFRLIGLNTVA